MRTLLTIGALLLTVTSLIGAPYFINRGIPFEDGLSLGRLDAISKINKFGYNFDIDAGVEETVWDGGGIYTYLASAQAMEVVSTDANDAAAGTGARTVQFTCLDSNWDEFNENVTLNGLTPVNLTGTCVRAYRGKVLTAGSNGTNIGNIILRVQGGGTTVAQITANYGQTLMAVYTVPNGHTFVLARVWCAGKGNSGADINFRLVARDFGGALQTKVLTDLRMGGTSFLGVPYHPVNPSFAGRTDIAIRATSSSNNSSVSCGFDGNLYNTTKQDYKVQP